MLPPDQNELLTRVEGDAPMGGMLAQHFWVPALKSSAVEADGPPVRVRLLGRNYVVFRGSDGKVACLDERCPHRGASLVLARNEKCALRCIFHGWKIEADGTVSEVPTQTTDPQRFAKSVKVGRYQAREAGGLIWLWLGEGDTPPQFPHFEFTTLAPERVSIRMATVNFNWFQGVEANQDSSHVGILHRNFVGGLGNLQMMAQNSTPLYEVAGTPYGYQAVALRGMADGSTYMRITEFVMPWYSLIPPIDMADSERMAILAVPIDDRTTNMIYIRYDNEKTVDPEHYQKILETEDFKILGGGEGNNWGQDRDAMKKGNFSGFHNLVLEDIAVQLSMGPIADRSDEQLCSGDKAIIQARRLMLRTVQAAKEGTAPPTSGLSQAEYTAIRSRADVLPPGADWREACGRAEL